MTTTDTELQHRVAEIAKAAAEANARRLQAEADLRRHGQAVTGIGGRK